VDAATIGFKIVIIPTPRISIAIKGAHIALRADRPTERVTTSSELRERFRKRANAASTAIRGMIIYMLLGEVSSVRPTASDSETVPGSKRWASSIRSINPKRKKNPKVSPEKYKRNLRAK
jgi:hypothetical protein